MIDVDAMQERIRTANPVPDSEQLDHDELARFAAGAALPRQISDEVGAEPSLRRPTQLRGPLVAVGAAAIALGAVTIAAVLIQTIGSDNVSREDPSPVASEAAEPTSSVPDPAVNTKRLMPAAAGNPAPLSTEIGDIEFELLEFEPPGNGLWQMAWTEHSLVSIADGRLYWSTDYYNWESVGPVNGDELAVAGDYLIVHGGPGSPARYSWNGDSWVESGLVPVGDVGHFVFGSTGGVALQGDTFLYSSDGVTFKPAEQAPRARVENAGQGRCPEGWGPSLTQALAATEEGYIALIPTSSAWWSTEPVCEPVVWSSDDGSRWDLVAAETPFGEDSVVYRVAARNGRVVAAGALPGTPAVVWVSDDGVTWDRIDLDLESIDCLAAGELGWVISGGNPGYEHLMMLSADGINWGGPYQRPMALRTGYIPPQFVVGDEAILGTGGDGGALLIRVED